MQSSDTFFIDSLNKLFHQQLSFWRFQTIILMWHHQCKKLGNIFAGQRYKLCSCFMVISDVYKSFIPNRNTSIWYCFTQWITKLPGSFEIHWVRQYLVNFLGLAGMINLNVYKAGPMFMGLGHSKLSWFLTLHHCNAACPLSYNICSLSHSFSTRPPCIIE